MLSAGKRSDPLPVKVSSSLYIARSCDADIRSRIEELFRALGRTGYQLREGAITRIVVICTTHHQERSVGVVVLPVPIYTR